MLKILGWITAVLVVAWLTLEIKSEIGVAPNKKVLRQQFSKVSYFNGKHFIGPKVFTSALAVAKRPKGSLATFFHILINSSAARPVSTSKNFLLKKEDFLALDSAITRVYWLGHASAIVELGGLRLAIDPVLSNAAPVPGLVRRCQQAVIKRCDFPKIDVVLITHNHYDHLERRTVQAISHKNPKARFVVPLGLKATLVHWGIIEDNIIELAWEEEFTYGTLTVSAEPSAHFSGRGLTDHNLTAWNAYALINRATNEKIFWGCDGGYGEHFKAIGKKFGGFDWVALEIDAWNQRWPRIHLTPREVLRALYDLNAKTLLPIHWGVFNLADHKFSESIEKLLKLAAAKRIAATIVTPRMGQLWEPSKAKEVLVERWWR